MGPKCSATRGQIAATPEENLERLAHAGFLVEDPTPICFICGIKGHGKSECPSKMEGSKSFELTLTVERPRSTPIVCCINCGEEGHRMRDCPKERKEFDSITCRICKQSPFVIVAYTSQHGHMSRDCPDKLPPGCRNCG
jgi:Zinc knuckle